VRQIGGKEGGPKSAKKFRKGGDNCCQTIGKIKVGHEVGKNNEQAVCKKVVSKQKIYMAKNYGKVRKILAMKWKRVVVCGEEIGNRCERVGKEGGHKLVKNFGMVAENCCQEVRR